jgi:hypothetical protein
MRPALAIMKKNLLSIICAVVAVLAIVAIFWPISGYYADLQTQVEARKSAYSAAKALLEKPRTLPILDPLSTDPIPLKGFPTQVVIDAGDKARVAIANESKNMLDTATKLVAHQPLVPNALPNGSSIDATTFLHQYQMLMTYPATDPQQTQFSLPVSILQAAVPPTDLEIKAKQDDVKTEVTQEETKTDSTGAVINAADVAAKVEQEMDEVPNSMRNEVALGNKMYIAPNAYHLNPALTGVNPPSLVEMFNGQMGLWLLKDVFSALAAANADTSPGIMNSRVKHLIKIDFVDDPFKAVVSGNADQSAVPPAADPLNPPKVLTISATGHVSNALYDVIPFNLTIIVDAAEVPTVLEMLSKDRFITLLRMDMLTVDSGSAVLAGYIYGNKPVVQLNLTCEALFFRSDTGPYMPDSIKKALGIQPPVAAAPAQ